MLEPLGGNCAVLPLLFVAGAAGGTAGSGLLGEFVGSAASRGRGAEADGIITRTVYPEVPPRVEYALSDLGESMRPIMDAMAAWGPDYKKSKE